MDADDDGSVVEELGDDGGRDHKLLVIVVHAVLLESSFVGFDPVSNIEVHGFQFPNEWPSSAIRMSLRLCANGYGGERRWHHWLTNQLKQQITDSEAKVGSILDFNTLNEKTLDLNTQKEESLDLDLDSQIGKNQKYMDVDDDGSVVEVGKSFFVLGFLKKVFTQELGDDGGHDHKLLVIVVHVVLLESSFVGFDPVSNIEVHGVNGNVNGIDTVVLKFQSLEKFFNVYGSLANGSVTHWVMCEWIRRRKEMASLVHKPTGQQDIHNAVASKLSSYKIYDAGNCLAGNFLE
ncbi:unnamed protein product [Ilex paraguariensis]|uniref:Uncharacterized protein n=1 Tax=Ilex paraguariensis TaxID=185542 RepID=A0ABC8R7V6_9AQUA